MSLIPRSLLPSVTPRATAALLALALCAQGARGGPAAAQQEARDTGPAFVQVDLPPSGAVRIENSLGGVRLEVWGETFLAVSARVEGGAVRDSPAADSPVSFSRTDSLLTISVKGARPAPPGRTTRGARKAAAPRAAAARVEPQRVDIVVRLPAHARAEVSTGAGVVEVVGLPARLDAQTVSGDLRVAVPRDADLMARTLYGAISVAPELDARAGPPPSSPRDRFAARLGAGGRLVRLSTARGDIDISAAQEAAAVSRPPAADSRSRGAESPAPAPESSPNAPGAERPARPPGGEPPRLSSGGRGGVSRGQPPVIAGAAAGAQPTPAPAQTPSPGAPVEVGDEEVLTVDTNLVTLNFSVVDRQSGRALAGLTGGDFKIFEDGVEQPISHFESANAPFDLLLLLDLSGSTARVNDLIRASAQRFVDSVRPADRVGVVAFAAQPRVVSALTSDKATLRSRLSALGAPLGDTKLYDAINYALEQLSADSPKERRRAVVLLTDGLDSALPNVQGDGSVLQYKELRRRVQEFEGLFYAVVTDNYLEPQSPLDVQPETYDLAYDRMEELAADAGGLFYEAERLEDVAGIYARVVEDLGTVYSISYLPANKARDGRWRKVSVRLPRRPTAVARGRSGYYAK